MITEETVFIIGAGASKPYEFPTGKELRKQLCFDLTERIKPYIKRENRANPHDYRSIENKILEFSSVFFKSSNQSIDLFLAKNTRFSQIGKIGVLACILDAENKSKFREEMDNEDEDWYSYLFHRMSEDLTKPEHYKRFCDNKVSFITFNYDRSLEYFMEESLSNSFTNVIYSNLDYKDFIPFPFLHVYGCVANLPSKSGNVLEYRKTIDYSKLDKLKDNIKLIFDRTGNELETIKSTISNAKRIFFLGFGFAKENLEALDIPKTINTEQEIFGTTYRFTEKEMEYIIRILCPPQIGYLSKSEKAMKKGNVILKNSDCKSLLREFL